MRLSRRSFLGHSVTGISALPVLASTTSFSAAASGTKSMGEAKYVSVDGIRTRYFEGGEGENIVFVHGGHFGGTTSAARWMSIFPSVASRFHVYAVDKLGMGLTDNPRKDEGYSMQATVQHIHRFLETLGIDQAHLVGHSRGGLPVGRIATDHPAMVKTVTIVDSNTIAPGDPGLSTSNLPPAGPPPTKESIRQELLRSGDTFHKEFVTDEYVEALLEVRSQPKIREAALRLELLRTRWVEKNFEKTRERPALRNNSGSGWWMYEVKDESLDRIRSGQLKVPTLIIWGRNDRTAPYQLGIDLFEVVSKSVDRAQLHIFNQCGHYPYHDYPEEFVNLLVSFIEGAKG